MDEKQLDDLVSAGRQSVMISEELRDFTDESSIADQLLDVPMQTNVDERIITSSNDCKLIVGDNECECAFISYEHLANGMVTLELAAMLPSSVVLKFVLDGPSAYEMFGHRVNLAKQAFTSKKISRLSIDVQYMITITHADSRPRPI